MIEQKAGRQSRWEVTIVAVVTVVTGDSGTVMGTVMKERCKIQVYIATDGLIRKGMTEVEMTRRSQKC